jgi:hypothetical protein
MATIKQVLAAISQDGTLGPNQKRFVTEAIQRAETWCQLQVGPKPRKITNAKGLVTLGEWEATEKAKGWCTRMMTWASENSLSPLAVDSLIEEFRSEMLAKGKKYADFYLAFQNYLRRGYLSKNLEQCRSQSQTTIQTKGISL